MKIFTVDIVSKGEQVAIISTEKGWYISYAIPDARIDTINDLPLSRRFATFQEAKEFWLKEYKGGFINDDFKAL